jgi:uncharacterized protein (TIGR02246 family)
MNTQLFRGIASMALGATLLGSVAWAQSHGTAADESAITALIESIDGGSGNLTKARQYASDADWTNAFGRRIHGREAISQWFDSLSRSADYQAGVNPSESRKLDVRFIRPDVAVVHQYVERVGQIDPTINKPMPTRKIHLQYVLSKEDRKWLIQSELIMDEEHYQKPK